MRFGKLVHYYPLFLKGIGVTIYLSFIALILGFIVGLLFALMRLSKHKILRAISQIYVEVIRDTPIVVQLMIAYFVLPKVFNFHYPDIFHMSEAFTCGAMVMFLNSGAYVAEIIRGGIQSIDKGQTEASRSLGLGYWPTMRYVIIPQAIKNILPALANEFISLVKESSIMYFIGIKDIMSMANTVKNNMYSATEPYLFAALLYFVITFTLSKLVGRFEKKLNV